MLMRKRQRCLCIVLKLFLRELGLFKMPQRAEARDRAVQIATAPWSTCLGRRHVIPSASTAANSDPSIMALSTGSAGRVAKDRRKRGTSPRQWEAAAEKEGLSRSDPIAPGVGWGLEFQVYALHSTFC